MQPVEQKWIVRIVLQKIEMGINFRVIMDYVSPHALSLYQSINNLKEFCKRMSDPNYVRILNMTHDQNAKEIVDVSR
jgi:hypothetical protein